MTVPAEGGQSPDERHIVERKRAFCIQVLVPDYITSALLDWAGGDPLADRAAYIPSLDDYRRRPPHPDRQAGGSGRVGVDSDDRPLVTILVAVYNGEPYLEHALRSAIGQSYANTELLVVDGASRDGTLDTLRRFDSHITRWFSEPDENYYDALNKGIAASRGRFIKILNADDLLPPTSVDAAVSWFTAHDEEECLRGQLELIDGSGQLVQTITNAQRAPYLPAFFPVLHPTWYVPRSLYERLGGYMTRFRVCGDYEYFYRLHDAGVRVAYLDTPLAQLRIGGISGGIRGSFEGLEVNRHYVGRPKAAEILLRTLGKKARLAALNRILGPDQAIQMNARVARILRRVRRE